MNHLTSSAMMVEKLSLTRPLSPDQLTVTGISIEDFQALILELEESRNSLQDNLHALDHKINALRAMLSPTALTSPDLIHKAHINNEQLINHNQNIHLYYQRFRSHVSETMVAALGVNSGYVQITSSTFSLVFEWICKATGVIFPPAQFPALAVSFSVDYFDKAKRTKLLEKFKVFGIVLKDAEDFGEKMACRLIEARFLAGEELSEEQADRDAEALIYAVVNADTHLSIHSEESLDILMKHILEAEHKKPTLSSSLSFESIDLSTIARTLRRRPLESAQLSPPPEAKDPQHNYSSERFFSKDQKEKPEPQKTCCIIF